MKNARLVLAVILAQLLPLAARAETCSQVYVKSPSAVTVFNKTPKTLWVNMGDMPSKGKEGLAYGYKVINPGQAVCFGLGVRGRGMWVREANHNDALFFPLGRESIADVIRVTKGIEIFSEKAGFVETEFKTRVGDFFESGKSQKILHKYLALVPASGQGTVKWLDYAQLYRDGSIKMRRDVLLHYEKPKEGSVQKK